MPPRRFGRGWRDRAHAVVCRGRAWPSALSLRFREDAVEYPAVGEEALLRRLPAAKILVDAHQLQLGKLRGLFRPRRGIVGAVMIPPEDVLRTGRRALFEIGLGHTARAVPRRIALAPRNSLLATKPHRTG